MKGRHLASPRGMLLLVAILLAGCTEGTASTSPLHRLAPPGTGTTRLLSHIDHEGDEMSVVDETGGVEYVLNVTTRQLRRSSDGYAITLTVDQAAATANAMASAVLNDPSIADLENLTLRDPGGCTGTGTDYCDASVWPVPVYDEFASSAGAVVAVRGSQPAGNPRLPSSDDASISSLLDGDPCRNIINAAMPTVIDYRGKRASPFRRVFDAAVSIASNALPIGTPEAVQYDADLVDMMGSGIAIGFLRANWNSYGCGFGTVVAGPFYHKDGTYYQAALGPTYHYECHYESWRVSWSGAPGTWDSVTVSVCDFVNDE
jgi:hypothetical protein